MTQAGFGTKRTPYGARAVTIVFPQRGIPCDGQVDLSCTIAGTTVKLSKTRFDGLELGRTVLHSEAATRNRIRSFMPEQAFEAFASLLF